MVSDINNLIKLIASGEVEKALRWVSSSDTDTDFSGFRNAYNETAPQYCIHISIDMPDVALEVMHRMDKKSLENRTSDDETLITSARGYTSIVSYLLDIGIDPETRNENGITLFAVLAEIGQLDLMKRLVEQYNVNISDDESDSALILSAMSDNYETVSYLLDINVDLEEHFLNSWGKEYIEELKKYKRLEEYYQMIIKCDLLELIPTEVKDLFLF